MTGHYNVLFLCTGNRARSILAEGILNHKGKPRFTAHSAGSHPHGVVHPLAIRELQQAGISTEGFRSKSWDEFAGPGAPRMDFVFTLCDSAAKESMPGMARPADDGALGNSRSGKCRRGPSHAGTGVSRCVCNTRPAHRIIPRLVPCEPRQAGNQARARSNRPPARFARV